MKKDWTPLKFKKPKENIGNIIELRWGFEKCGCIVKIVYRYQEKRVLVLKELGMAEVKKNYLELFSKEREYYQDDMTWRYILENEMMAYL